jgi:hypothetical protein
LKGVKGILEEGKMGRGDDELSPLLPLLLFFLF